MLERKDFRDHLLCVNKARFEVVGKFSDLNDACDACQYGEVYLWFGVEHIYVLQRTTDVGPVDWQPIDTLFERWLSA